jgi:HAE1 family hydrophobic/amphiphilic exporter-1
VDTINRLRASGLALVEAIEKAAAMRLRPIIITTATTVLGLLPLAIGGGQGGELQQPLALTLISGLLVSTLLTLVVIPVVYKSFASVLSVEDEELSSGGV